MVSSPSLRGAAGDVAIQSVPVLDWIASLRLAMTGLGWKSEELFLEGFRRKLNIWDGRYLRPPDGPLVILTVSNLAPQCCLLRCSKFLQRHLNRLEIEVIHRHLPLIV